jgi:hypothetical protein
MRMFGLIRGGGQKLLITVQRLAECWVLTQKDEPKLAVFERKVLRTISGPIRDTDQWRRTYNEELYQLYAEPEIVK